MELLPTTYTFGIAYKGGYIQKAQDVAQDRNVVFRTVNVTFEILSQDGQPLAGDADYYARGWKQFGSGTTSIKRRRPLNMEMLPTSYTFAATVDGQRKQYAQNVQHDPHVVFGMQQSASDVFKHSGASEADDQSTYWDCVQTLLRLW